MSIRDARQKSHTTPPGSFAKEPLTPPPSEQKSGTIGKQIIQEIEDQYSRRGYSTNPWQRYKLPPAEYKYVEQQLQIEDKVRYCYIIHKDRLEHNFLTISRFDYFPSASLFVLRMPSSVHEYFKNSVADDIVQQLRSIAQEKGPASEFARRIKHGGSSSITFSDPEYGKHDPDDQFSYDQALFSNVILEVSYTQKRKAVARLADEYILGSDGNVSVVIGIDIDYKDKSATLSMWRPQLHVNIAGEEELVAHQTLSNQVCSLSFCLAFAYLSKEFRTVNGDVSSQPGLRLQLDDFVPSVILPKDTKLDKDIFISSADLCAYLREAEHKESSAKQMVGIAKPLNPALKKRPMSSSPIEELNTDDESQFQQKEERAAQGIYQIKQSKSRP